MSALFSCSPSRLPLRLRLRLPFRSTPTPMPAIPPAAHTVEHIRTPDAKFRRQLWTTSNIAGRSVITRFRHRYQDFAGKRDMYGPSHLQTAPAASTVHTVAACGTTLHTPEYDLGTRNALFALRASSFELQAPSMNAPPPRHAAYTHQYTHVHNLQDPFTSHLAMLPMAAMILSPRGIHCSVPAPRTA